ncbi:MAG: efflux RND transporter periplasmic adaptor subunit [Candidatus Pacebacteria bacterium]|nr:efflux RND transporter periplasmic adaptor subunit [Candidatus Paceibacterota bacterium]
MHNETIEKIEEEVKTIEKKIEKTGVFKKPWVQSLIAMVLIFGALGGFLYWQSVRGNVFVENSYLNAPIANMGPNTPGVLNAIYVKEGDRVTAGQQIALVGSETLFAKDNGLVANAPEVVGSYFTPGQTIVSIVADQQMEVVGSLNETDGLKNIASGQRATFTVDTFPGKVYEGVVDKVGVTSDDTGVIFSISDKRPVKKFSVYVAFDVSKYPELKSGMSAKITVHTLK